jgi:beta-1,4-N-acetylglucosaminyltransferase
MQTNEASKLPPSKNNYVFVTVGSTSFDDLISAVHSTTILKELKQQGYDQVIYQIGRGIFIPKNKNNDIIQVMYFRSKPSIAPYIQNAGLVICHAGVGTVMETLRMKKKVIVVVNPSLMDNHQLEVAAALEEDEHIYLCRSPNNIELVLTKIKDNTPLLPIKDLDKTLFPTLLESELSLSTTVANGSTSSSSILTIAIIVLGISLYMSFI